MNLAEQNLVKIKEEIGTLTALLHQLNNPDASDYLTTKPTLSAKEIAEMIADLFEAKKQQQEIISDDIQGQIKIIAESYPKRCRFKEYRGVKVLYSNGSKITIYSPYYIIKGSGRKKNRGIMPALALVGIHKQCSADMSSYIAKLCSALSSYQEVVSLLRDKGIHLNVKTIISISRDVSKRARLALKADEHLVCFNKGKRVVICVDGGRVRVRRKKRGPKTAKGRNRYHGDWREVKLFVIYIIDENGNKERKELPIMDGIIGSAAQIMTLLKDYLASLNLDQADQIVFVADGAQWIWNRAKDLILSLGVDESKYMEVLDYYHAMEHLNKLALLLFKTSKEQKAWINKCKKLLMQGENQAFIDKLKADTDPVNNKEFNTECNYFVNNQKRMNYKLARDKGIPIGSGAVESGIRRVVNLRMKGNSIFWNEEAANDMIFLRSYYKSDRWDNLENMSFKGGLKLAS